MMVESEGHGDYGVRCRFNREVRLGFFFRLGTSSD